MNAIILAAGRGSRMKNLTSDKPKCLVQLNGKTLIQWQLDALNQAGISNIAVVTGYKRELIADLDLIEFYNKRWSETNMVYSLECAKEWLVKEPCIISYSDIFYQFEAVQSLIDCNSSLAITYDPHWLKLWSRRFSDPLLDAETFRVDNQGILLEIGNKSNCLQDIQGQYMGLLRITPESWSEFSLMLAQQPSEDRDNLDMTSALQKVLLSRRMDIAAIPYTGVWGEVDSEQDLNVYCNNWLQK